jgi:hypothetical protein
MCSIIWQELDVIYEGVDIQTLEGATFMGKLFTFLRAVKRVRASN